jgi:hypothetical protein
MQTFRPVAARLYREELITYETARDAATNADDFDLKVKGIFSTGEMTWETSGAGQQSQPGSAAPAGRGPRPGARPSTGRGPFSKKP